jgi:DNA-binding LacI/PurR family transcriptional regulator
LSIGTVSRALNDQPDVKAETRARVKEAALRSGYVPNQSGRSLRKGTTGIVAAVIPTIGPCENSDGGILKVLEGARRTLRAQDLDLIIMLRGPEEDAMENLRRIVSRRIADALIITQTVANDARLSYLAEAAVTHVSFGRSEGDASGNWVDFDYATAVRETVRMLARDGHRRVALVQSGRDLSFERVIARAFREEARGAGIPETGLTVLNADPRDDTIRALFRDSDSRPTAVLASHESVAGHLYSLLPPRGVRIGVDVALVSMSPVIDGAALTPPLSCYDCDLDGAGAALGTRIVALMAGGSAGDPAPELMPMRFVARQSHSFVSGAVRA